jgi:hypothetical protein
VPAAISNAAMFRVTFAVDEGILRAMKAAPDLASQAIQKAAEDWHDKILPNHFKKEAHSLYNYAERSPSYLRQSFKSGKNDLVYRGGLAHDLKSRASYQIGAQLSVSLKMSARVLNFVPRMAENDQSLKVTHRDGRSYPNLKREIKAITPAEQEALAQSITARLEAAFTGLSTSISRSAATSQTPSLVKRES